MKAHIAFLLTLILMIGLPMEINAAQRGTDKEGIINSNHKSNSKLEKRIKKLQKKIEKIFVKNDTHSVLDNDTNGEEDENKKTDTSPIKAAAYIVLLVMLGIIASVLFLAWVLNSLIEDIFGI